MSHHSPFLSLLLLTLLAVVVPVVVSRVRSVRLPVVVGEIVAGIASVRVDLTWWSRRSPS